MGQFLSKNADNNIDVNQANFDATTASNSDFMEDSMDMGSAIDDWEASVDAAGPFADIEDMRALLATAPKGAPSFNLLKDMVSIRSRKQG